MRSAAGRRLLATAGFLVAVAGLAWWLERRDAGGPEPLLVDDLPLRTLSVQRGAVSTSLHRDPEGRWRVGDRPADGAAVEGLLSSLAAAAVRPVARVGDVEELASFGLERERLAIQWTTAEDRPPRRLVLGTPVPAAPGRVYARLDDRLVTVPQQLVEVSAIEPRRFASRTLLSFPWGEVRGLTLQRPELAGRRASLTFVRRPGGGWEVPGDQREVDAVRVRSLISRLASLQALEFVQPSPAPTESPVASVHVELRQASHGVSLWPPTGGAGQVRARVDGGAEVLVRRDVLEDALRADADWFRTPATSAIRSEGS